MSKLSNQPQFATPREVFDRLHHFVLGYDADNQAELFASDAVWEFPFAPEGIPRRIEGREKIRSIAKTGMERSKQSSRRLTGYHSVVVHETSDPEVIIVEFELHGEIIATGEIYQIPYIQVIRVSNGMIVSLHDYFPGEVLVSTACGPWTISFKLDITARRKIRCWRHIPFSVSWRE
ncbi:MAG: nuclear transport factor 2 family protein [Chloroflexi bacterium]|nr:nuclear transport factor 2 family protein [Chloroflexota bacterium]